MQLKMEWCSSTRVCAAGRIQHAPFELWHALVRSTARFSGFLKVFENAKHKATRKDCRGLCGLCQKLLRSKSTKHVLQISNTTSEWASAQQACVTPALATTPHGIILETRPRCCCCCYCCLLSAAACGRPQGLRAVPLPAGCTVALQDQGPDEVRSSAGISTRVLNMDT
jgi:hypothetical protein